MNLAGHTADDQYNFTFISEPSQIANVTESGGECEAQRDVEENVSMEPNDDDDMQLLDQVDVVREPQQSNQRSNQRMAAVGLRTNVQKKVNKSSSKKNSGDDLVGVMQRFVDIKEKQAKEETTQDFSISKCIVVLKTVQGVTLDEKIKAYDVFKIPKNREIFVNAAMDQDGSALVASQSDGQVTMR